MLSFITALCLGLALSYQIHAIPKSGNPPQRRQLTSMCYDPVTKSLLTYGGFESASNSFSDMWIFDLATQKWTLIVPASYSTPRKL